MILFILRDRGLKRVFSKLTRSNTRRLICQFSRTSTVLSANIKCRAVPIVADRADFVPGPQLQNGTKYELQTFTVISSLRDVSEFVKIVRIL